MHLTPPQMAHAGHKQVRIGNSYLWVARGLEDGTMQLEADLPGVKENVLE